MLKNNLTVLPTSRAIRQFRTANLTKNSLLPKYISIGEFFQRVVLDKNNKKVCDKNLKILFLKDAIKNSQLNKLGLSHDFSTFIKQSEYLFRFFTELANEYVQFDTLLQYDTYTHYSDHIEVLKEIYKNYCDILEQNSYVDNITLPNSFIINQDYIEQFETINIYLEGYLSKFEQKIINEIAKINRLNITISLNEFNLKNKNIFDCKEELSSGFEYTIDLTNQKIKKAKKLKSNTQNITISPVTSQIEQIAFIKYNISQMIQKGTDAQKIALLVPDEKFADMLELFDKENYFNFAMGRSIKNTKLVQTLKHISKLIVDYEPKDSEISKFLELDMKIFETIFKQNWKKQLTIELFNEIFTYLFSLTQNNEELYEKLETVKISLEVLLFVNNTTKQITLKEFIKLLQTQVSSITLDDTHGGKITVLGILETRLVEFEGVIVCDFNDDKVPRISIKDKFISSNLKELSNLPSTTDRENLQRYYYKRVFDKAKELSICFIQNESQVMSRFIMQLFNEYKNYLVKKDYSSILFQTKQLQYTNKDIVLDIDLSLQSWSATALKTYLGCKRKYYLQYIANIKEHTISIKPQNFDIGNIIHNCLDDAFKNNNINKSYINTYLSKESKNNPYLTLELELWKKRLEKFLELEKSREKQNITIFKTELPFNLNYNGINIKGKIDRIDKHPDNTYEILDYKTSSSLKIDTPKNYEDSKDFQLEFYYLASRDKMIKDVGYYDLYNTQVKKETLLEEKLKLLDIHFKTLKTTQVNFTQTQNTNECQFCSYKTICGKD